MNLDNDKTRMNNEKKMFVCYSFQYYKQLTDDQLWRCISHVLPGKKCVSNVKHFQKYLYLTANLQILQFFFFLNQMTPRCCFVFAHICSNDLAPCITARWWRVVSGSCPRNHGAEAAAPTEQPMITRDWRLRILFTSSRTVRRSFRILTDGFRACLPAPRIWWFCIWEL